MDSLLLFTIVLAIALSAIAMLLFLGRQKKEEKPLPVFECFVCNKETNNPIVRDEKFCSFECLEKHLLQKIDRITEEKKRWNAAWHDMRDIVGKLGYKYCIPESYKDKNYNDIYRLWFEGK